jgi:ABC-2 type transport system permease protein
VTARPLSPRSVTRSAQPFDQRPLSPRVTWATAVRVLGQLRRDPRTIVLMLVVPSILLTLFKYVFYGQEETFDRVGGPLVGLFPFIVMFLITSITMLRERTTGTLERLMTLPLSKLDLLAGYGIAFALVAAAQALVTSAVAFGLLGLDVAGSIAVVVVLAVCNALLGVALGLLASAFAQSEFQAVQFMPAFVLPQILLCGLLVPRDLMHEVLEGISVFLPLTWAYDGLARAVAGGDSALIARDVAVVLGVTVLALSLGAATLRRRTP